MRTRSFAVLGSTKTVGGWRSLCIGSNGPHGNLAEFPKIAACCKPRRNRGMLQASNRSIQQNGGLNIAIIVVLNREWIEPSDANTGIIHTINCTIHIIFFGKIHSYGKLSGYRPAHKLNQYSYYVKLHIKYTTSVLEHGRKRLSRIQPLQRSVHTSGQMKRLGITSLHYSSEEIKPVKDRAASTGKETF